MTHHDSPDYLCVSRIEARTSALQHFGPRWCGREPLSDALLCLFKYTVLWVTDAVHILSNDTVSGPPHQRGWTRCDTFRFDQVPESLVGCLCDSRNRFIMTSTVETNQQRTEKRELPSSALLRMGPGMRSSSDFEIWTEFRPFYI